MDDLSWEDGAQSRSGRRANIARQILIPVAYAVGLAACGTAVYDAWKHGTPLAKASVQLNIEAFSVALDQFIGPAKIATALASACGGLLIAAHMTGKMGTRTLTELTPQAAPEEAQSLEVATVHAVDGCRPEAAGLPQEGPGLQPETVILVRGYGRHAALQPLEPAFVGVTT